MSFSTLLAMSDTVYNAVYVPGCIIAVAAMFIAALAAIVLILFQQSNSEGIQGITATSETFFGKNKGRSVESRLKRWTWVCLIVLAVLSLVFYILQLFI